MSGDSTIRMIEAYDSMRPAQRFLTSMFQTPARNFHSSEQVEVDITRSDESISIPVTDLSVGPRHVSQDLYTNKRFTPPIHNEDYHIPAYKLMNRREGMNPFEDPDFLANARFEALKGAAKMEDRIRRSIELQASQIFQEGKVDLLNRDGVAVYSIDFKPKASHFFDAAAGWTGATAAQIINDLNNAAEAIRDDSLEDPDMLIFGSSAFEAFINNAGIKDRLDTRRIDVGNIQPMAPVGGQGGQFRGTIDVGNYKFDIWTYNGKYTNPENGVTTTYVGKDNVIMRSSTGRLDATYGDIPYFAFPGDPVAQLNLPTRISQGVDIHMMVWATPNRRNLFVETASRPLLIPTAIDTIARINTAP